MGFTTGDWELRAKDAKGNKIALKGQYLTVWKKAEGRLVESLVG
jgi:hypothetical protein